MSKLFVMPIPTEKGCLTEYSGPYPIKDMILARKYLIDELYARPAGTDLLMNIKKKTGIFTADVIEYFLEDKKPLGFVESREKPDNNDDTVMRMEEYHELPIDDGDLGSVLSEKPTKSNDQVQTFSKYSYISRDPKDYKWVTSSYKPSNNQESSENKLPPPTSTSQSSSSSSSKPPPPPPDVDNSLYIKQLSSQLNMTHACEKTFCPKAIEVVDPTSHSQGKEIYVCDFCHWSSSSQKSILAHLDRDLHVSASVYLADRLQEGEESFKAFEKIKQLKSRTSMLSSPRDLFRAYAFCPYCLFCFGPNIQACATHYECTHRQSDRIYSIARPFDKLEISITKAHACCECKTEFKRLTELSKHIKESRHMPYTKLGQINLFKCPFDGCPFQSIDFTDFKTHLLQHKYFQEAVDGQAEKSIKCLVLLFNRPTEYYHIADYNYQLGCDIDEQISSIDQSIDTMKGHSDHNEILKLLRIKKMELIKLQTTKSKSNH